jgi:hypothetical protein
MRSSKPVSENGNRPGTADGLRADFLFKIIPHTPKAPKAAQTVARMPPPSLATLPRKLPPKGSGDPEIRQENDTFGVNGVWSMTPQQKIERSETPSDQGEDGEPFGVSPQEDGGDKANDGEGS